MALWAGVANLAVAPAGLGGFGLGTSLIEFVGVAEGAAGTALPVYAYYAPGFGNRHPGGRALPFIVLFAGGSPWGMEGSYVHAGGTIILFGSHSDMYSGWDILDEVIPRDPDECEHGFIGLQAGVFHGSGDAGTGLYMGLRIGLGMLFVPRERAP